MMSRQGHTQAADLPLRIMGEDAPWLSNASRCGANLGLAPTAGAWVICVSQVEEGRMRGMPSACCGPDVDCDFIPLGESHCLISMR